MKDNWKSWLAEPHSQRTYYCLTAWLLLVFGGVPICSSSASPGNYGDTYSRGIPGIQLKTCNDVSNLEYNINHGAEWRIPQNHRLEGVIGLFRHGDRGPLGDLESLKSSHCTISDVQSQGHFDFYKWAVTNPQYEVERNTMYNSMAKHNRENRASLLIPSQKCEKGLLTPRGILQHMYMGAQFRSIYFPRLFRDNQMTKDQITVFSTPFKRTYQSGHAFLSKFLKDKDFNRVVNFKESKRVNFCFKDCDCDAYKGYMRLYGTEKSKFYESFPQVKKQVRRLSQYMYTSSQSKKNSDAFKIRDDLVFHLCHAAGSYNNQFRDDIISVFDYVDKEAMVAVKSRSKHLRKALMLGGYGLFKNIFQQIQNIIKRGIPQLVLYFGHDETIKHLSAAFGILDQNTFLPPYASRFIIEVYSHQPPGSRKEYSFRLIFNGIDYTGDIPFCRGGREDKTPFMCPVRNLERYLFEDYFKIFGDPNFKAACRK